VKNTVILEDCIMVKEQKVSAGSKILEGFISPFSATVVARLLDAGYEIAGKAEMDEFGIPDFFCAEKSGENLCGSVKAVAEGAAEFALCNDVFGKIQAQAAENNLCYIRPTYGTVSRYGLIPLVSSMDSIGVVCKNFRDGFALLSKIAGKDENDGAMVAKPLNSQPKIRSEAGFNSEKKIAIPKNFPEMKKIFSEKFDTTEIELENFEVYKHIMYILSCAEISNDVSRYDGIKFGHRAENFRGVNDLYMKTRAEGFGAHVKFAAIMGAAVLSQDNYIPYYEKSMKIRRIIKENLRFDAYDIIAMPHKISDDAYENLSLSLAALTGLPSISFSKSKCGVQLVAKNENSLLSASEVFS
jgi:aspartyl-tRNA(Asn)/glutamyl-tRNA(Gln) amidotransferase subunit A